MFERTLVPVAYGERPEELRTIGVMLKNYGVRSVCLYHVDESGSLFPGSDLPWLMLLQEALEEVGLATEVKRGTGSVAPSIAETAMFQGCDGICLRGKRRWHLQTTRLGGVAQGLLRISDVPVFVHKIPPHLPDGEEGRGRDERIVLYVTSLDAASVRPLPCLMEFGGARCHVLHVRERVDDPSTDHMRRDAIDDALNTVLRDLSPYFDRVSSEQRIGAPARQVLHVAERLKADVIVLGRDTPEFLSGPMNDPAELIVNASKASVCLVP